MGQKLLAIAVALPMWLTGCAGGPDRSSPAPEVSEPASTERPPERIVAERGGFIPEGIEYDQTNRRFLVGSLTDGTVYQLHDDGALTPVVEDPELRSSIGIEVDEPRNRLLVANSDAAVFDGSVSGQAKLGVYELSSGEQIAMVDLAKSLSDASADWKYFANDVTVGDDGTIYVTDSRTNTIYRVDGDYTPSVLYRFQPSEERTDLMLNGLVFHPSGFLLVADSASGDLYKVPVEDPGALTRVVLPEPVEGADGVVWQSEARLAIVSNSHSRVVALTSTDQWVSAEIAGVARFEGRATTAAVVAGDIYVVQPHFDDQDPPTVERVTFQR
jgi:sugar lactone lactonase YvrE